MPSDRIEPPSDSVPDDVVLPCATEPPSISAVIERAHDLAAVSHLIPPGEWTPALVALVAALHDLTRGPRVTDDPPSISEAR